MKLLGKKVWRLWMRFVEWFGDVQMIALLTLVYWTVFAVTAISFRILSDALRLKRAGGIGWVARRDDREISDYMKSQY